MRPRLLRPDNFTPPTRTPWGGRAILDAYKRGLDLGDAADIAVCGESWEISVEPSFPSRFADDDTLLADAIAAQPRAWLGAGGQVQTPLLVKLLDARDDLSVQVHPAASDPDLAADESGKVECWYVLDAAPGAGLYLGFRDGVTAAEVERCVRGGGQLDSLMNFVPVVAGDAFVIEPGTVHAVGAGLTLVEPQYVVPGRKALTYRFWDWNRRYDAGGARAADGQPRQLHTDRAFAVTAWDAPRGDEFLASCRARPSTITDGTLRRVRVACCSRFVLERWSGSGALAVPATDTMLAVVCVGGAGELRTAAGDVAIRRGVSAVVPAACGALEVVSDAGDPDHLDLLVTRVR